MSGQGMTFGEAIERTRKGFCVAREGWNGKGMWIAFSPGSPGLRAADLWSPAARSYAEANGGSAVVLPSLIMRTATGEILMGWLASQTDMLATDWVDVLPA